MGAIGFDSPMARQRSSISWARRPFQREPDLGVTSVKYDFSGRRRGQRRGPLGLRLYAVNGHHSWREYRHAPAPCRAGPERAAARDAAPSWFTGARQIGKSTLSEVLTPGGAAFCPRRPRRRRAGPKRVPRRWWGGSAPVTLTRCSASRTCSWGGSGRATAAEGPGSSYLRARRTCCSCAGCPNRSRGGPVI